MRSVNVPSTSSANPANWTLPDPPGFHSQVPGPISALDVQLIQEQVKIDVAAAIAIGVSASAGGNGSAGEIEAVNPLRPQIEATAEEQAQFYADRASILARYPNYEYGPESDPIFTDPTAAVVLEESPPPIYIEPGVFADGNGSIDQVAGAFEPLLDDSGPGGGPMADLSDLFGIGTSFLGGFLGATGGTPSILGDIETVGQATAQELPAILGGLAQTYLGYGGGGAPTGSPTSVPAIPAAYGGPVQPGGGYVGCISQRDIAIGVAAGVSPEKVDLVLKIARRGKNRRKRMLTKSDIGDISTMVALLGKGSESFKIWLAKATR